MTILYPGMVLFPYEAKWAAHKTIILSNVLPDNKIITVNMTSKKETSDTTSVLHKSDYDLLEHPTIIEYYRMEFDNVDIIERSIKERRLNVNKKLSDDILKYVQRGACLSSALNNKYRCYCCRLFCKCPRDDTDELDRCPDCHDISKRCNGL